MRKSNEENERVKRDYFEFLRHAEGQDEASIDKVVAALLMFEESTGFKTFKSWHRDQAVRFKAHLGKRQNARTKTLLSLSTRDAMLRAVQKFFRWLASQPGYKSRVSYADVAYLNNFAKDARAARGPRPIPYPSMEQCAHAFLAMQEGSEVQRRDKAIFALLMLTGARDGALASLRLKHVNLFDGQIFQDGRDVATKASKTIDSYYMPVDPMYRETFEQWVIYLRETKLFGPEDALFPKDRTGVTDGRFANLGLSRDPYSNGAKVRAIVQGAFEFVQMPPYIPHSFRKTLVLNADKVCRSLEEMKAVSLNLGHDNLGTTADSYMPVSRERQKELLKVIAARSVGGSRSL